MSFALLISNGKSFHKVGPAKTQNWAYCLGTVWVLNVLFIDFRSQRLNSSSRDDYIERSIKEVDSTFTVIGEHRLVLFDFFLDSALKKTVAELKSLSRLFMIVIRFESFCAFQLSFISPLNYTSFSQDENFVGAHITAFLICMNSQK